MQICEFLSISFITKIVKSLSMCQSVTFKNLMSQHLCNYLKEKKKTLHSHVI